MSRTSGRTPPASTNRVQVTMLDEAAEFLRSYSDKHDVTIAEAVRRGLGLLALADEMAPAEQLAIVNEREQTAEPVELPWHARQARRVPLSLVGNRPARRRVVR